jgi:protein disulfide-isomerase
MDMKLKSILTLGLFALSMVSFAAEGWLTSWDEATKQSKKTGKPILADFTGSDWCGWCIKLKKEVFNLPEFKKWASANVILLELDFPTEKVAQSDALKKQNAALRDKYKIRGYPTILFLDAEGKVLGQSGYREGGPSAWTKHAESIIKKK